MAGNYQNNNRGGRTSTTTHIRTIVSSGVSCITVKFYNNSLSFQFMPFQGKKADGSDQYDRKNFIMTTINYDSAYAMMQFATNIAENKIEGNQASMVIPCANNTTLALDWKRETGCTFTVTRNNMTIPFNFQRMNINGMKDGQPTTIVVESGLGSFAEIFKGYLQGINSERHLNKLTDDFAKMMENNNQAKGGFQPRNNNNNGGGYNKFQGNNSTPAPWDNGASNNIPTVGLDNLNVQ